LRQPPVNPLVNVSFNAAAPFATQEIPTHASSLIGLIR
jgi:hypothetical protein